MQRTWLHIAEFNQCISEVSLNSNGNSLILPRDSKFGINYYTLFHLNIQSVNSKIEELEIFLEQENIDILCLTEHWLKNELNNIGPNYVCIASFSRTKYENGG